MATKSDADRRRGRPLFQPTREQRQMVQVLSAHGISHATICKNIGDAGIDARTLRRAFRDELKNGKEQVKAAMIASLIKAGLGGNVNAQRYWLICFGGPEWRGAANNADVPPPNAGTGTTIIIKGGLPPVVYTDTPAPVDDDEQPPQRVNGANGNANGAGH